MSDYLVTWQIDVAADDPRAAAKAALDVQRDPTAIATVFSVQEHDSNTMHAIDLMDEHATWAPIGFDPKDDLDDRIGQLDRALDFLDLCRAQPGSGETGAYRDALEWIESAAREVIDAHFAVTQAAKAQAATPEPPKAA